MDRHGLSRGSPAPRSRGSAGWSSGRSDSSGPVPMGPFPAPEPMGAVVEPAERSCVGPSRLLGDPLSGGQDASAAEKGKALALVLISSSNSEGSAPWLASTSAKRRRSPCGTGVAPPFTRRRVAASSKEVEIPDVSPISWRRLRRWVYILALWF